MLALFGEAFSNARFFKPNKRGIKKKRVAELSYLDLVSICIRWSVYREGKSVVKMQLATPLLGAAATLPATLIFLKCIPLDFHTLKVFSN